MAYKPHRGTLLIDKNIQITHECYYEFYRETDTMRKSKIAYKWYRAESYLKYGLKNYYIAISDFKNQCLIDSTNVYKPFLNLIQNV